MAYVSGYSKSPWVRFDDKNTRWTADSVILWLAQFREEFSDGLLSGY